MVQSKRKFPEAFVWGAAGSATQSLGAADSSNWMVHERQGLAPRSGAGNGKRDKFDEDFMRLAEMGVTNYRMSLDWSRIEPDRGMYSREAVEEFKLMMDSASRRGITLWVSLLHVSQPYWFSRIGGFTDHTAFSYWHKFVELVAREFGKMAEFWIPIHEPTTLAAGSYLLGRFPPGKKRLDKFSDAMAMIHQAHGDAYRILKAYLPPSGKVGAVTQIVPFQPRDPESRQDSSAADFFDNLFNRATIVALKEGVISMPGRACLELPSCKGAADFLGIDYFQRVTTGSGVRACNSFYSGLSEIEGMPSVSSVCGDETVTECGTGAHPEGIYEAIRMAHQADLGLPIYVTGAGVSTSDEDFRVNYLGRSLAQVEKAVVQGLNVRGYFHWSDVDLYDWFKGFDAHFGLFGFDPATFDRIERPAARFYSSVIKNGFVPDAAGAAAETGTG